MNLFMFLQTKAKQKLEACRKATEFNCKAFPRCSSALGQETNAGKESEN